MQAAITPVPSRAFQSAARRRAAPWLGGNIWCQMEACAGVRVGGTPFQRPKSTNRPRPGSLSRAWEQPRRDQVR